MVCVPEYNQGSNSWALKPHNLSPWTLIRASLSRIWVGYLVILQALTFAGLFEGGFMMWIPISIHSFIPYHPEIFLANQRKAIPSC